MDAKEILSKVLKIIDYQDDIEKFVNGFFSNIYIESVAQEANKLTEEKKVEMGKEMEQSTEEKEQKEILLKYFSKHEFNNTLEKVTKDQFTDYLEAVYPSLSNQKKDELSEFLTNLPQPQ